MSQKEIDEKKNFEIEFDDDATAKAKAEAENRGESVEDDEPKKVVKKTTDDKAQESGEDDEQEESEEEEKEDKAPAKEESNKEKDKKQSFPSKKGEKESEESYNLRTQLKIAQEGRDNASSEEEKSAYEKRMDELRKGISQESKKAEEKPKTEGDDDVDTSKIDEETLKKLGLVKKEEVEQIFSTKLNELRRNEIIDGHQNAIRAFYKDRPDIAADREVKNFLEQYVMDLIKPDLNTTPKQLLDAMKLVADAKFPKANRSSAARAGQEKVDAMNIEGGGGRGSGGKKSTVAEDTSDLLKSMGWSDDDIGTFG